MTRVLFLWLTLIALLIIGCETRKPVPPLDNRHVITVEGATVRYNGKQLRWDVPVDKWKEVLGPPSRKVRDIYVWDQLGVYISQVSSRNKKPVAFTVLLGRKMHSPITTGEPDFWPKQTFAGRLVVDEALIHKNSTINEINHDKKGTSFGRGRLSTIFNYYFEDYYISLEFGYDHTLRGFNVIK